MCLILAIILICNIIIFFHFIDSLNENIGNIRQTTKTFFLQKVQNETKELERIKSEISRKVNLANLVDGENILELEALNNIIHSETIASARPIYSLVFDKNGIITFSSVSLPQQITDKLNAFFKSYIKNPNNSAFYFFKSPNTNFDEMYTCVFDTIQKPNYKNASFDIHGYLCVISSVNLGEFLYGYNLSDTVELSLYNGEFNVEISNGNTDKNQLEIGDTHITGTGWYFNGFVDYNFTKNSLFRFILIMSIETVLLLSVIIFFIFDTRKTTLIPLQKIVDFLDSFVLSEKFTPLKISSTKEIESITEALNNMVYRNKSLSNKVLLNQQRLYEQEKLNEDTTIYALQSQVNPHFLYNTFEIIRSLAVINRMSEIESIAVNLSKILRYNLSNSFLVTIKDELEIIKCYIAIMDIKYKDEFEIEYDIPEEIYSEKILRMTFQPIIENCFNHGFSVDRKKFKIKLSAHIDNENLVLKFRDNGIGCDTSELKKIRKNIYKNTIRHKHIGLPNLYNRLLLYYHGEFTLRFDSVENEYTEVTIISKLQEGNSNKDAKLDESV